MSDDLVNMSDVNATLGKVSASDPPLNIRVALIEEKIEKISNTIKELQFAFEQSAKHTAPDNSADIVELAETVRLLSKQVFGSYS